MTFGGPVVDLLALALLAFFALLGARRGVLASGLALLTLVGAYGAAILAAQRLGAPLAHALALRSALGPPLAGFGAFLGSFLLLVLVSRTLRRRQARRQGAKPRGALDRLGGGAFGATRGLVVVLLLGWLLLWVDALQSVRSAEPAEAPAASLLSKVTQTVVEAGIEAALADREAGGKVAARALARPSETLGGLRTVVENPGVQHLVNDRAFWSQVEGGAVDAALDRASFRNVLQDDALRQDLARLGLIDAASAHDPAVLRDRAAQVLDRVGPRLRRLHQDPELQRMAADPEVSGMLQRGELFALFRRPDFQRLVSRALSNGAAPE
jgi:membrane protein required for colicin V production